MTAEGLPALAYLYGFVIFESVPHGEPTVLNSIPRKTLFFSSLLNVLSTLLQTVSRLIQYNSSVLNEREKIPQDQRQYLNFSQKFI